MKSQCTGTPPAFVFLEAGKRQLVFWEAGKRKLVFLEAGKRQLTDIPSCFLGRLTKARKCTLTGSTRV